MTVCTLLFYRGGSGLLDRLISWFEQHSPYTHVALRFPDGSVCEELAGGLVRHTGADAQRVAHAAAAYKTVPVSDAGLAKMQAFSQDILARHGTYALDQLVFDAAQRFGVTISNDGDGAAWVCSGYAAAALQAGGYRFSKDCRAITPNDLALAFAPLEPGAPA